MARQYDENFTKTVEKFSGKVQIATSELEEVYVTLNPELWSVQFSEALVNKVADSNHELSKNLKLLVEEVNQLMKYAIKTRVDYVHGRKVNKANNNELYVPVWVEMIISKIGIVELPEYGIKVIPVYEDDVISYEEAVRISSRIKRAIRHIAIVNNWLDSDRKGDPDVMTLVLVDEVIKGWKADSGAQAYISVFLGARLREESLFKSLFRVNYGSIRQFDTQFQLYLSEVI